jgi:hypothetical protein
MEREAASQPTPAAELDSHDMLSAIDAAVLAVAESRTTPEAKLIESAAFWIRRQLSYSGDPLQLGLLLDFMKGSLVPAAQCSFSSHSTNQEFLTDFENYINRRVLEGDRCDFPALRRDQTDASQITTN